MKKGKNGINLSNKTHGIFGYLSLSTKDIFEKVNKTKHNSTENNNLS
jgi:hypothetical protein